MELAGHSAVLLSQLNAQREFGFLCDCTVAIGDVFFKAHKAVLAAFSNYFRTLFVHQDSDCVRLKPADIQPEIFSFLLNLMYTGRLSPQVIDPLRLEQGVKFLHAYPLLQGVGQVVPTAPFHPGLGTPLASSPYGIQISDQPSWVLSWRQVSSPTKSDQSGSKGAAGEPGLAHSPVEGVARANPSATEHQGPVAPATPYGRSGAVRKRRASGRRHHPCHLCRSVFGQRSGLREHLLLHAQVLLQAQALLPTAGAGSLESSTPGASPGGSAPSPGGPTPEQSARDVIVVSDGELPPPADSPGTEAGETPSPSDAADVPEGGDPGREAPPRRRYECSTCGRRFIQKSHWREHTYIHTGKPYRCAACGKSFCRANQAARHACAGQTDQPCANDDGSQGEAPFLAAAGPYKCNMCEAVLSTPGEILRHPCFTQNAAVHAGWGNWRAVAGEGLPKDDESDCSNSEPFIRPVKTEKILPE
ncbi:zinc finger and BTB domain-containing protein 2-like [Megalops cyprinoides]|uniref:zinc finger and BTB domain-containing protein 2-like n=1 Tax=Megalops cyprinoides TaxID=118141 RepID=UPI001865164C|nr:zinc finger and BTB domain-containing protein 2-like [Megalops cyprinoides]